jgi:hypothetical protein
MCGLADVRMTKDEQEHDKQEIRVVCRKVMRSKKARTSERLQAAQLLAGIQGLYGPGRPRVLARTSVSAEPPKLNNQSPQVNSMAMILARVYDESSSADPENVQRVCNQRP